MRPSLGRMQHNLPAVKVNKEELEAIKNLAKGHKNLSEYIRLKVLCKHPNCPIKNNEERFKIAHESVMKSVHGNRSNVA